MHSYRYHSDIGTNLLEGLTMGNPYSALFVDEGSALDEQVSAALRGVVQLVRGKDCVVPADGFGRLSLTQRIVAFALSKFAIARSGEVLGAKMTATSREYAQAAGADLK